MFDLARLEVALPSYRVAAASISLAMFDVVGQDGDESAFIGHTGLGQICRFAERCQYSRARDGTTLAWSKMPRVP